MEVIYDPLRGKSVCLTPEERVRQWFIHELVSTFAVPSHMMMSEVGFKYGGKPYRADILVYSREGLPLVVVECKRPEVEITSDVAAQAMRYDTVLCVRFIILTNGHSTFLYKREGNTFVPCNSIPTYDQMQ